MFGLSAAAIAALLGILAAGAGAQAGFSNSRREDGKKLAQQILNENPEITNLSDAEALLNEYYGEDFHLLNPGSWFNGYDMDAYNADKAAYMQWKDQVGERPADLDYDAILQNAYSTIDAQDAKVNSIYDQIGNSYRDELAANNAAYNDYVSQTMSNNAQNMSMLQGSVRSEMSRAQRNAITRGASAAQRMVASINAQMGLQNKAATQALETSNQLAQALLSQRQAAAGIRSGYNANLANQAQLAATSAERKGSYANSQLALGENLHDAKLDQWKNRLSAYGGNSPWASAYDKSQTQNNSSKSTYGI